MLRRSAIRATARTAIEFSVFCKINSHLLGAVAVWLWSRRNHAYADRYVVPVASGLIASESAV